LRHFGRGFGHDAPAFDGLTLRDEEGLGGPILGDAFAYLDAEVASEFDAGDHRLFLARVVAGQVLDGSAEPMLHVRHNGFHY
jgi:flavin reductase (DIM6/NTAB) family NADH-FMN oxidoreductase RutF